MCKTAEQSTIIFNSVYRYGALIYTKKQTNTAKIKKQKQYTWDGVEDDLNWAIIIITTTTIIRKKNLKKYCKNEVWNQNINLWSEAVNENKQKKKSKKLYIFKSSNSLTIATTTTTTMANIGIKTETE